MMITAELEELEKEKVYFAHMMKLRDFKIKKIKTEQDLVKINEEITKVELSISKLQEK